MFTEKEISTPDLTLLFPPMAFPPIEKSPLNEAESVILERWQSVNKISPQKALGKIVKFGLRNTQTNAFNPVFGWDEQARQQVIDGEKYVPMYLVDYLKFSLNPNIHQAAAIMQRQQHYPVPTEIEALEHQIDQFKMTSRTHNFFMSRLADRAKPSWNFWDSPLGLETPYLVIGDRFKGQQSYQSMLESWHKHLIRTNNNGKVTR